DGCRTGLISSRPLHYLCPRYTHLYREGARGGTAMADQSPPTILCLASYEKGIPFLREGNRQGARMLLITVPTLEHAPWPRENIDEIYFMPDLTDVQAVINGVAYLARTHRIDRIVPLDEYDVLTAAALREHFRLPGLSLSATRFLRDKLAMRMRAQERGIPVPEFVAAVNDEQIRAYTTCVPGPWLLKPRAEASTIGITRLSTPEEIWSHLDTLGDRRSYHLIERYLPGEVYHVDSIIAGGEVVFAVASMYGRPPLDVFHEGGIALTRMLPRGSQDEQALQALNRRVLQALGPVEGSTHMEFIKAAADGHFYFLEVAARVGGAYISDAIEAATGLNLWAEWAKIETARADQPYQLPAHRQDYAGVIISLARQETPDTSAYQDPEIVWRLEKPHHVGFIVVSADAARVWSLLDQYSARFTADFGATMPPYTSRPPSHS
ncbi:MAG TPA: hypothetical protein VHB98_12875, partial [Chloroflexota bacterium]|nr:hypothetical protein [Chloroflexota bacterium]